MRPPRGAGLSRFSSCGILQGMKKVWSERAGETFGGVSKHAAARAAKYRYQKKEMELEAEQTTLSRLNASLRGKKEEQARLRRTLEKHQLESVRLEGQERFLQRERDDLQAKVATQKSHVNRLEHEVEVLREESFRGQRFGA